MHGHQHHGPLAAQFLVQVIEDVEIAIDLQITRRLQELGHLERLLLRRPLEVEQFANRRFAGVHGHELEADPVAESLAVQVIDPVDNHDTALAVESQLVLVIAELEIGQVVAHDCAAAIAFRTETQPRRTDVAFGARER